MIRREVRRLFAPKGEKREDWPLPLCAGAALFIFFFIFKILILGKMMVRNVVMVMLFVTVIAPIILYTDRLGSFQVSSSSCKLFFSL